MTIHRVTAPTWAELGDKLDALTAQLEEDGIPYRTETDAATKSVFVTELSPPRRLPDRSRQAAQWSVNDED